MSPTERLDFLITHFRVLTRVSPSGAADALGKSMAEKDPVQLAATLAVAVERLAAQEGR